MVEKIKRKAFLIESPQIDKWEDLLSRTLESDVKEIKSRRRQSSLSIVWIEDEEGKEEIPYIQNSAYKGS